jgi:hypothetical protein
MFAANPSASTDWIGPINFSLNPTTNNLSYGGQPFYDYYNYNNDYPYVYRDNPASRSFPNGPLITCSLSELCQLTCTSTGADGKKLLKFTLHEKTDSGTAVSYLKLGTAAGPVGVVLTAVSV